jgi:endonuclease/exonuclease/phosphatase family metal-dependent hydrolase
VLTWNLFHGRSLPDSRRELLGEFACVLAGWDWDVALLQECPPWWPEPLARACGAEQRHVLTSRNALLPMRRFVATRRPDLMRSNGGGSNAILVRRPSVSEHRAVRLCRWPERRWMHAVRLASGGWIANVHASGPNALAIRDCAQAGLTLRRWALGGPALLGGDFNVAAPPVAGFALAGGHAVDGFLVAGWHVRGGRVSPLARGHLSDHEPVVVTLDNRP